MSHITMASQGNAAHDHFTWKGLKSLQDGYHRIMITEWSPYLGGLLIVLVFMGLMANGFFWGVFGGLKLWGNYFNNLIGLGPMLGISEQLQSPLLHRISLMDIALVLGAFSAALMARSFRINRPPKLEYVTGAFGGIMMGLGATLAGGCTTGGFFTPLLFSSPAGWAMWAGLIAGAYIGLKLLLWVMENITWGMIPPETKAHDSLKPYYPLFGFLVLIAVISWAAVWSISDNSKWVSRAVLIVSGFGLGFILLKSRFCLSRVIREPLMTGDGTMTKAMILALAVGIPLGSLMLQNQMPDDPYLAIPATFWLGSVIGGLIFGIGMVFAGGCASGSLWRMGEGHLKLWVSVFFFAWAGSTFSALFKQWGLLTRDINLDMIEFTQIGEQAFMPELFGSWGWAYLVSGSILLIWYLLVRYNEKTSKFCVF